MIERPGKRNDAAQAHTPIGRLESDLLRTRMICPCVSRTRRISKTSPKLLRESNRQFIRSSSRCQKLHSSRRYEAKAHAKCALTFFRSPVGGEGFAIWGNRW